MKIGKMKSFVLTVLVVCVMGSIGLSNRSQAMIIATFALSTDLPMDITGAIMATGTVLVITGSVTGGVLTPVWWAGVALENESQGVTKVLIPEDTAALVSVGLMTEVERGQILADMSRLDSEALGIGFSFDQFTEFVEETGSNQQAFTELAQQDGVSVATVRYLASKMGIQ